MLATRLASSLGGFIEPGMTSSNGFIHVPKNELLYKYFSVEVENDDK